MSQFSDMPDEFLVAKVRENFSFLTGESRPAPKKVGLTHVDGNTIEDHFVRGPSFLHMVIFNLAFTEARSRGLLNAVEVALCEEVLEALSA